MTARRHSSRNTLRPRRFFAGQASVEYIVVLAFGVMILLQPFSNPDTPGQPAEPVLKQVARAIKDYHKDYTYALAIAQIPDCDYTYETSLDQWASADVTKYFPTMPNPTLTVGVDRCLDWQNLAIPTPTVSISPFPTLPSSFGDAIKQIVTAAIDQAKNDMLSDISSFGLPTSLPF